MYYDFIGNSEGQAGCKGASVYVFFTFQAKLRREPVLTDGQWLNTVSKVEVYEQIKIL